MIIRKIFLLVLMGLIGNELTAAPNAGCYNDGNCCFMNATIQALFPLQPFRAFLEEIEKNGDYPQDSPMMTFINHINAMQVQKGSKLHVGNPEKKGVQLFREKFCTPFGMAGTGQHDAYEFLLKIFKLFSGKEKEKFTSILDINRCKITIGGETHKQLESSHVKPETGLLLEIEEDKKPIGKTLIDLLNHSFRPTFPPNISKDEVKKIGEIKTDIQKSNTLSTPLMHDDPIFMHRKKIAEALEARAASEVAKIKQNFPDNPQKPRYNVNEKEIAETLEHHIVGFAASLKNPSKNISPSLLKETENVLEIFGKRIEKKIIKLPRILIFQLKRFYANFHTGEKNKINTPISFPLDLNMSPYLSEESTTQSAHYQLRSFVVQSGTLDGGHYWAYAYDGCSIGGQATNLWYKHNDLSAVKKNVLSTVQTITSTGLDNGATPYLLFYERVNTEAEQAVQPALQEKIAELQGKINQLHTELQELLRKLALLKEKIQ